MTKQNALEFKGYTTVTFNAMGGDVEHVFGSINDLEPGNDADVRCCQAASAVWCSQAIVGKHDVNPMEDEDLKKTVEKLRTKCLEKGKEFNFVTDRSQRISQLKRLLGLVSLKCQNNDKGSTYLEVMNEIGMAGDVNSPTAWIIHQYWHVTAASRVNSNELYFYDNNIGCVKCNSFYGLRRYVRWAAERNDENEAWVGKKGKMMKQKQKPGTCLRCIR